MKCIPFVHAALPCLALAFLFSGCTSNTTSAKNPEAEAPPPAKVESVADAGIVKVQRPDEFPLVTAAGRDAAPELNVTGTVSPDVSKNVPVISLATGRVVELDARLGDRVVKGQLLMRVQSADISAAFSDYRKAVANETLARTQLDRAQLLYDKGAIAQKDLEVAEDTGKGEG